MAETKDIPSLFGSMVFNRSVMRERLPKDICDALERTISQGRHLNLDVANVVAAAMKDWAVEKGATHFTHWFQPMTGITAGKHNSFISPKADGKIIMEFSGKELVSGESDASAFPSGGLRATFEARGYTVWDITSYAFIKDRTMFIPTAFCSYNGEALDKKTPLLRSMEALDKQTLRILKLFGNTSVKCAFPMVGPEQEYFLIDKYAYLNRPDLIHTGRTLFGARPPKGQEMEDHYYGSLKPRIAAYMMDLEEELWKLGVTAKIKHNEAAPSQHELVPVYTTTNIATDHNQITMEMMKSVANRHGLACLLHEKPFAGVNGSGKHINWSICTDKGANLFEPGATPHDNAQFLLFLTAVIKAVDDYNDLIRSSVASAGNDHRLGGNEAPPAIVSIFLGDELTGILEALESGADYSNKEKHSMEIGVTVLPHFSKDLTDRNRTSPFAFTGNKFEFRMPGSALSIADPDTVLNTVVAEVLRQFADSLEKAKDFKKELALLIKDTFHRHKRIIFNGNNYSEEWVNEAEKRGLSNRTNTVSALSELVTKKSVELFSGHHVFSEAELHSRYEILLEDYCKIMHIEALTMIDMVRRQIMPACIDYQNDLMKLQERKISNAKHKYDSSLEDYLLKNITKHCGALHKKLTNLESAVSRAGNSKDIFDRASSHRDLVFPAMAGLRLVADELETLVSQRHWPFPAYGELLYSIL